MDPLLNSMENLPPVCCTSLVHLDACTINAAKMPSHSIQLLLGVLKVQLSSFDILQQNSSSKAITHIILLWASISINMRWSQYVAKSYSSAAASIDTRSEPLSLNSTSTPIFASQMAYGNEDGDSGGQQSPEDNESRRSNSQSQLRRCRFACHFHKYSPSLYCAANCDERYKWCEKPGWESLAAVR